MRGSRPGFDTHRCRRCGNWWATNASHLSMVICTFCPTCVPSVTQQLADIPLVMVEPALTPSGVTSSVREIRKESPFPKPRLAQTTKDVAALRRRFRHKPTTKQAREFLACNQDHAVRVLWLAYERPKEQAS